MKKQIWLIIFFALLAVNVTGIQLNNDLLQSISKPLIIPVILGYFLSQTNNIANSFKKWIVAVLFFSWVGDVLLMFQSKKEIFFLLGLCSFMLAHIFYIIFFHHVRVKEEVKVSPWLLLIVVIYYSGLIYLLSPFLGDMKLPVLIYGIVISFMFMLAMHMLFIKNKPAGKWMMTGAFLFVISDSVLAINKFYQSFYLAGIIIMLAYGLAQLFIVKGAAIYITSNDKKIV